MHVYQMRSSNKAIVAATEQRMRTCMAALKEVSKIWLVAKMVHTLFQSILGNKHLEERLQKAAGRRHQRPSKTTATTTPRNGVQEGQPPQNKRKYDDIDAGFSGQPSHNVSYERSQPQTPAMTPSRELPPSQQNGGNGTHLDTTESSPPRAARTDAFMGASRANTRPTTPSGGPAYPGTPPDLFLVTRNSPTIPQDLWHNFEPGQLFPSEANLNFPTLSPQQQGATFMDPVMQQQVPANGTANQHNQHQHQHQQQQQFDAHLQQPFPDGQQTGDNMHGHHNDWAQFNAMNQRQRGNGNQVNEETWSNSSVSQGPIVPTTLNVQDWFQFFGMSGDANAINAFNQSANS